MSCDPHTPRACDRVLALADRFRWWAFAFAAAAYVAAFNGQWRVQPDAALYLTVGRNLAEGRGYTYLGHVSRVAYPGWPGIIAATFEVFGRASLVPVHLVMLAVTLGTLACVYRLVLLYRGRPTAVVVTVGVALTKAFFVYGFELWSDMPFALGAFAALAGYEGTFRRGYGRGYGRGYDVVLLAGGLAAALLTRPMGWPLLLAVAVALVFDARAGRVRWRTLAGVAAVAVAVAVGAWAMDPRRAAGEVGGVYERYVYDVFRDGPRAVGRLVGKNVVGLFTSAAPDVLFQVRLGVWGNLAFGLVVVGLGLGLFRRRAVWGVWFALLVGTVLLAQEALDRYFLPVLPLLVLAWWQTLVAVNRRLPGRWGNAAFLVVAGFGLFANASKVVGIVAQQRATPFLATYDRGRYAAVPALAEAVRERLREGDLLLVSRPYGRVLAYLTRRDAMNGVEATAADVAARPRVWVVEPADDGTRRLLAAAGLVEAGPPAFAAGVPAWGQFYRPATVTLRPTTRRSP